MGRLRLAPAIEPAFSGWPAVPGDGPVLLFVPAFDEEAAIADVLRRVPANAAGRQLQVVVVDDGSTDATVAIARSLGVEVVSIGANRGLGAAVRTGLALGVARRAAAVVFCDADGEYPPEEIDALVGPILDGQADYVVGSRFLGRIDHMRPHRRVGNVVLTTGLTFVARRRITDGQSGYRAFSPAAAAAAEVIHDYNNAQVLTLDLLAKGFRYHEVPISYRFRTTGRSFVTLGRYLRRVVPAVYRELNTPLRSPATQAGDGRSLAGAPSLASRHAAQDT
jgi:glycosyltransferase involved in cell wall biosynthesis